MEGLRATNAEEVLEVDGLRATNAEVVLEVEGSVALASSMI